MPTSRTRSAAVDLDDQPGHHIRRLQQIAVAVFLQETEAQGVAALAPVGAFDRRFAPHQLELLEWLEKLCELEPKPPRVTELRPIDRLPGVKLLATPLPDQAWRMAPSRSPGEYIGPYQ